MRALSFLVALLVPVSSLVAAAHGQTPRGGRLNAGGLSSEALLLSIHSGAFERIPFDRHDLEFVVLFQAYLDACARACKSMLPPNRVEMTTEECVAERVSINGFGVETSRTCAEWRTRGRGLFADPELLRAKQALSRNSRRNLLGNAVSSLSSEESGMSAVGNAFAQVARIEAFQTSIERDMRLLFENNECGGDGIERFEDNLLLFAQGRGFVTIAPFRESDYTRLAEALITRDANNWAFNRFVSRSVRSVAVEARDAEGRPTLVRGRYRYDGLNGRMDGTFTLSFSDGIPQCLYFFDAPGTCRPLYRDLVSAYLSGNYWLSAGSGTPGTPHVHTRAAWADNRPEWTEYFGGGLMAHDWIAEYESAPNNFAPEPVDSGAAHISIINRVPGSRLLSAVLLGSWSWSFLPDADRYVETTRGSMMPWYSALNVNSPANFAIVREDYEAVGAQPGAPGRLGKQMILQCWYFEELRGHRIYYFWYRARPPAADPERLRSRLANHPFLKFRGVAERCPASAEGMPG
jgi:hypothetical protein